MNIWVIIILVIVILWVISTSNSFNKYQVDIDNAFADIDATLEKRFDVVKNAYNAAMNYLNKEQQMFIETAKYRSGMTVSEMAEAEKKINECIEIFKATNEQYPELTAKDAMLNAQKVIISTEEELLAARRIYNNNVAILNKKVNNFPSSLIASIRKVKEREFFKVSEEKKKGFQIELD
ncbi:MAG: LemA family protein [Lachnospiraceae bacterium]|nr:LemA family protein [Lachnospiraceae bacterium]